MEKLLQTSIWIVNWLLRVVLLAVGTVLIMRILFGNLSTANHPSTKTLLLGSVIPLVTLAVLRIIISSFLKRSKK